MQLSELIAAVRDDVQDPGAARWTDTTITRYLNEAQLKLAQVSRQLHPWNQLLPAGTVFIALPADLLIIKNIYFEQASARYEGNLKFGLPPESAQVQGNPIDVYIVGGNTAYYYPVVSQDTTQIIAGIQRPAPMQADTDVPSIIDADDVLITYADYKCFLNDGDPMASAKKQIYEQERAEWSILDSLKNPMPTQIERIYRL